MANTAEVQRRARKEQMVEQRKASKVDTVLYGQSS